MTTWREKLQPASFRGVPFEHMSDSSPAGRRTQLHEFVQRDKPFVEDLGRITRPFSVTGFVGGDKALDARDALLAALDEPGAGELILPAWGAMQATCTRCTVGHDRLEGGLVRLDMEFVESGDKGYPIATPATDAMLEASADDLLDQAGNWFIDAMAQVDTARVNINAMRSSVQAAYGLVTGVVGTVTRIIASAADLVSMVLNSPAAFVSLIKGGLGSVRASLRSMSPGDALANLRGALKGGSQLSRVSPSGGAQTVAAVRAVNELVRSVQLVVAQECAAQLSAQRPATRPAVAASVWQQASQPIERPEILYLPDVLTARDLLDASLWEAQQGTVTADVAAVNVSPPMPVFAALQECRAVSRKHLAQVASAAVPLIVITPAAVQPALVLAYRQWGDATRMSEVVQRNRVAHPGFVPPQPLQVARE